MNIFTQYCEKGQVEIPALDTKLQALADEGYITRAELRVIYRALDQACDDIVHACKEGK